MISALDPTPPVRGLHKAIVNAARSQPPNVGATPATVVWSRGKMRLLRYHADCVPAGPAVLIVTSLMGRSYVLDLRPADSFVGTLLAGGFDVYLVDWGAADSAENQHTFETYIDRYLEPAVRIVHNRSDQAGVSLVGYCLGAVLALLLQARHPDLPTRGVATLAAPIDLREIGFFTKVLKAGRVDVNDLLDDTGNISPRVIRNSFRLLKPTSDATQTVALAKSLSNDGRLAVHRAMDHWINDHVPFSGALARQIVSTMVERNALVEQAPVLRGRTVTLRHMRRPLLNIVAARDDIVPAAASTCLPELVGSTQRSQVLVDAGHVGLVLGRSARSTTLPVLVQWLRNQA
jgi:polyhydroxyalkanoate synthase subunit PhaC